MHIIGKSAEYDRRFANELCGSLGDYYQNDEGENETFYLDFYQNIFARYCDVLEYQPKEEEKEEFEHLLKHREALLRYAEKLEPQSGVENEVIIQEICRDINSLSSQRRSFCVPGGSSDHAVCYEFCLEEDGTYTFILYNKGDHCENRKFHGDVSFLKDGREYVRSRVQIQKLTKEAIQNNSFLNALIDVYRRKDSKTEEIYGQLKQYLLIQAQGQIRKPLDEDSWKNCRTADALKQIEGRLQKDCDFHSAQIWETCTESNLQTPEHFIVSPQLRKKIKLHAIQRAWSKASQGRLYSCYLQKKVESKISKLLSNKFRQY